METASTARSPQGLPSTLRERKKQRTRQRIADAAEGLFARKGFDAVTVADVARNAEVAEQTVYNYFATKEALVLDESEAFATRFRAMVRQRPQDQSLLGAVRAESAWFIAQISRRPASSDHRGSMPYLVATCPAIRRHWLALLERYAHIVATALLEDSRGLSLPAAKVLGMAVVGVFAVIIDELGQAMVDEIPLPARLRALRRQMKRAIDQMANGFV